MKTHQPVRPANHSPPSTAEVKIHGCMKLYPPLTHISLRFGA